MYMWYVVRLYSAISDSNDHIIYLMLACGGVSNPIQSKMGAFSSRHIVINAMLWMHH